MKWRTSNLFQLFKNHKRKKPPYLERIDELKKLDIVRLKGKITQDIIPVIEARIKENRQLGSKIDKNVVLDFAKVEDVDSATVAFHVIHLKEYHENGFEVGFININDEMKALLDLFKENAVFKVFSSEAEAVKALNR